MATYTWPPISVTTSPPVGASTAANQVLEIAQLTAINGNTDGLETLATAGNASLASIDGKTPALVGGKVPVDTGLIQALTDTQLRATAVPVTANAGANLNTSALALETTQTAGNVLTGSVTETAPASDTASSGLNGRLQRVAQRLTSLITLLPTSLGSKADAASLAVTQSTEDKAIQGALTETAPASDTASSGLNGRLQRIAQRLTSLIALFPTALGQGTMATSMKVVLPSDQSAIPTTVGASTGAVTSIQKSLPTANTAVRATVSGSVLTSSNKKRRIKPSTANTGRIWIGPSTVTTSNGLEIVGPDTLIFDGDYSDYYVVSDTNAQVVEIIESN